MTRKVTRYQQEGDHVCKYGAHSNFTCGRIVGRNYHEDWLVDSNKTFIRVDRWDSGGTDRTHELRGDSGGPVFYSGTAMGLVSGERWAVDGNGPRKDMLYMAVNYLSDSFLRIRRVQTVN